MNPLTHPRRLNRRVLGLGLAAGILGLASGWSRASGFEVSRWPASATTPGLEALDLEGSTWRLSDLRGRAVVLNFWASWCEPCRAEMPSLQQLAEFYGPDKLTVLAVNFKESALKVSQYVRATGLSLPVLLDPRGELARAWGAQVFPTSVLLGPDGRPRQRIKGALDWSGREAAALVEPLLRR